MRTWCSCLLCINARLYKKLAYTIQRILPILRPSISPRSPGFFVGPGPVGGGPSAQPPGQQHFEVNVKY